MRGSIATAGASTATVGGNTACLEVEHRGQTLILDAGTGLRALGERLAARDHPVDVAILVSHLHWDHIQGFPFFLPAYARGTGSPSTARTPAGTSGKRSRRRCPRRISRWGIEAMRAELRFCTVDADQLFPVGGVLVRTAPAHHPSGCLASASSWGRALPGPWP